MYALRTQFIADSQPVKMGSKADVTLLNFDVRFTPESGHSPTRSECLLWADFVASATKSANSGHRAAIDPFSASLDFLAI